MKDFKDIKVLLYGTGAVGGLYGGKLAQAGAQVSVVCRSDYNEVRRDGIFIESIYGDYHFIPRSVIKNGSEYGENPDYVIVAVKVLPEIDVVSMIRESVHPGTSIVMLQNGIGNEKPVADVFDNEVIGGLAFVCASRTGYGHINHSDYGRVVFGTYPSGISEKVKVLVEMFNRASVPAEAEPDVIAARWKKLLWNAPFNPLSVICGGADTYELMSDAELKHLAENVMREIFNIAAADGHPVAEELIKKNIDDTIKMKPYKTSMLLDYESKRPVELDAILGSARQIARVKKIATPHIDTLYAILGILNKKNIASK